MGKLRSKTCLWLPAAGLLLLHWELGLVVFHYPVSFQLLGWERCQKKRFPVLGGRRWPGLSGVEAGWPVVGGMNGEESGRKHRGSQTWDGRASQ